MKVEQEQWQKLLEGNKAASGKEALASTIDSSQLSSLSAYCDDDNRYPSVYSRIAEVPARIGVLENSMRCMERLIMAAERRKDSTFELLHSNEFGKFPHVSRPKCIIKALTQ